MNSNRKEFTPEIHYKSNAPVKNHSQPQFVAEDYLEGNRRHSTDFRDGLAFDKGQQPTDGHIYQVTQSLSHVIRLHADPCQPHAILI